MKMFVLLLDLFGLSSERLEEAWKYIAWNADYNTSM